MTNTYPEDASYETKLFEEIRCLRCVNERLLRAIDEGQFPKYQMEKFSGSSETRREINDSKILFLTDLHVIRADCEIILNKLNTSLFADYELEKTKTDKIHEFVEELDIK